MFSYWGCLVCFLSLRVGFFVFFCLFVRSFLFIWVFCGFFFGGEEGLVVFLVFFGGGGNKGAVRASSEKSHGFILTSSEFGMSM